MMPLLAVALLVQTSIGPNGITAPGVHIDGSGIHTEGTTVDGAGVHATRHPGTIVIRTNGNRRTVDCGGQSLSVQGNANHLDAANCRRVSVLGNHNVVAVRFTAAGTLTVPGNDNVVTWSAPRTVRIGASALGSRNKLSRG